MLSQTVGYAIHALAFLAGVERKQVLVRDIAAATDIPSAYLSKIINILAKRGFVVTQRGIKGGVTLARPAGDVTLYDLCEAMDDPLTQDRCMLGLSSCNDQMNCPAHEFWRRHRGGMMDYLQSTTLVDLATTGRLPGRAGDPPAAASELGERNE